jgi:hypothetical protein
MSQHNIYRDGKIHVCKTECSTCIFRKGNLMHLQSGRVRGMIDESKAKEGAIVCHQTLGTDSNAVCRGFFDRYKTQYLQVAERLNMIEEQETKEAS